MSSTPYVSVPMKCTATNELTRLHLPIDFLLHERGHCLWVWDPVAQDAWPYNQGNMGTITLRKLLPRLPRATYDPEHNVVRFT